MSIQNNVFYKTYDYADGRTHLALGADYIDSVNTYTCCLSILFAKLFKKTIDVMVGDKEVCFNKKSYLHLLHRLGKKEINLQSIGTQKNFGEVIATVEFTKGIKMRDKISHSARSAFTHKLQLAIRDGNAERAKLFIGKGAAVEGTYIDRGAEFSLANNTHTEGLYREAVYSFHVFKGAPIIQAAHKGMADVAKQLKEFGARTEEVGQSFDFERIITGSRTEEYWDTETDIVPQTSIHFSGGRHYGRHGHCHGRRGGIYTSTDYHFVSRPVLKTRVVNIYGDRVSNVLNYKLNNQLEVVQTA